MRAPAAPRSRARPAEAVSSAVWRLALAVDGGGAAAAGLPAPAGVAVSFRHVVWFVVVLCRILLQRVVGVCCRFRLFWTSAWNVFDFLIVLASVLTLIPGFESVHTHARTRTCTHTRTTTHAHTRAYGHARAKTGTCRSATRRFCERSRPIPTPDGRGAREGAHFGNRQGGAFRE